MPNLREAKEDVPMTTSGSRRAFLQSVAAPAFAGLALQRRAGAQSAAGEPEWRNRQPGMAYRRFGRTNLMVSEIVCGGDPIRTDNYKHVALAVEMGLNYLDMAPAYGDGDCEIAYGKLLSTTVKRGQVFLTTKISAFSGTRNRMYQEIFDGLPADKQRAIVKRVDELRSANLAEKPGYYLDYFPGQRGQFPPTYLSNAMMPDYANRVEGSQSFRRVITESLDGSLKRVGTDHFDTVMCPHGACSAEELENPHI